MTNLEILESVRISLVEIQNQCTEAGKVGTRIYPQDIEEMIKALQSAVSLADEARKELAMAIRVIEEEQSTYTGSN